MADFHAAAFDLDPQLMPDCADRLKHQFLTQLLETPEYRELHESTALNEASAALAAVRFAEQFAGLRDEAATKERAGRREERDGTTPRPVPAGGDMEEEMAIVRAVGVALDGAAGDVAELEDATAALGMGPGGPGPYDPRRVAGLFRRVRRSDTLRRIVELAGRYRLVAQSKQRRKVVHGMDDLVGVTLDGEIARLVPGELARLVLPETEWDTLRRIVERQAMCRDYRAVGDGGQRADPRRRRRVGLDGRPEGAHRQGARPGDGLDRPQPAPLVRPDRLLGRRASWLRCGWFRWLSSQLHWKKVDKASAYLHPKGVGDNSMRTKPCKAEQRRPRCTASEAAYGQGWIA